MNKFKNPLTPLFPNPVNIDRPIQELQVALAGLGWIEKSFGRSFMTMKTSKGKFDTSTKSYPHVWQGDDGAGRVLDFLEVMPNDNLRAQSFFRIEDPQSITDWQPTADTSYQVPVSLIVWYNYKEIDASLTYPFIEILKGQVMNLLRNYTFADPYSNLAVQQVYENYANVWSGYSMNEIKDKDLTYPFGGFRIAMQINFREDCLAANSYGLPDYPYPIPTP